MAITVWTIGHSTHPIDEFVGLLTKYKVRLLADIRHYPTSRWPQFTQKALRESLSKAGIEYVHIAELGGYRSGGYEAHMRTEEFAKGLEALITLAEARRTAVMCAEAVFFRCHRRHVAEALVARGVEVVHIYPDGRGHPHRPQGSLDAYA